MSTPHDLQDLGFELDAHGFAGREVAIRRLVRLARAAGVGGAVTEVLADTSAPDVARQRAFAVVSARLAAMGPASDTNPPHRLAPVA